MRMAAYSSGYSPMKFHTDVNTSFTTKGSSLFNLHTNRRSNNVKQHISFGGYVLLNALSV
jgi:hypothetical protein